MLEKNGLLTLTESEETLILSGVIPERIKQNWEDLSLADLLHIVDKKLYEKVQTNGCN